MQVEGYLKKVEHEKEKAVLKKEFDAFDLEKDPNYEKVAQLNEETLDQMLSDYQSRPKFTHSRLDLNKTPFDPIHEESDDERELTMKTLTDLPSTVKSGTL